ncbi:hypothetical protein [Mycobacterium sp. ACS4331]|uniref:hypothetical protein n=1 Tax=Mycobacterium sp. ACS4331 TaxID=1834121 RepID=UPI001E3E7A7F|nr:hypothetical protein [Mycobacterium sp. ACS4331]
MSDNVGGKPAMQIGYRANGRPGTGTPVGGSRSAQMSRDALFVWLALSPEKFWVNLNPTEPDRIIDSGFGRTEAGRVLLEADLEMKRDAARLQSTETDLGRRYVAALQGESKCTDGRRHWIEPLPATVREDGDQLYIIDAPLIAKLGVEDSDISPGETCAQRGQSPDITRANLEVYQKMIIPALNELIANSPKYADLRRVYTSRVVAEWLRKRNAANPGGQFASVINSDNIDRWAQRWSPRGVFDDYVRSFNMNPPEATLKWTSPDGTMWTSTVGGVDFSRVEITDIGAEEFEKKYAPAMRTAAPSLVGPITSESGTEVWMGDVISSVPLEQIWPDRKRPWTPYVLAAPATSNPLFHVAVALPVAAWIGFGGMLLWRRRRRPL